MADIACIAWLAEDQVTLVRDVAERAGVRIAGAGSPVRGRAGGVAESLGAKAHDDLRSTLAGCECDLVFLADPGDFGTRPEDAAAIGHARARGARVVSLEPVPTSALDASRSPWREIAPVAFCPSARMSRPFREASDVLESFGPVRTLTIAAWRREIEGSLGACLFEACELVALLVGEPETIHAAYGAPRAAAGAVMSGAAGSPGETLRGLHGDMTATLRFADGRAANLAISDRAGRWNREITMLGENGRVRVFDDGFEWIGPDGARLDHARPRGRTRGSPPPDHAAEAIAEGLVQIVQSAHTPVDPADAYAMAQAALLSARTGQGESPATIRHLTGR